MAARIEGYRRRAAGGGAWRAVRSHRGCRRSRCCSSPAPMLRRGTSICAGSGARGTHTGRLCGLGRRGGSPHTPFPRADEAPTGPSRSAASVHSRRWPPTKLAKRARPSAASAAPDGPAADAVEARLFEYDDLIQRRLKPLVTARQAALEAVAAELAEWREQTAVLEALPGTGGARVDGVECLHPPVETLVDVGGGFMMAGRIDAIDRIVLDVGCGVQVELTRDEALAAARRRVTYLERREAALREEATTLVADLCMAGAAFTALLRAGNDG